MGSETKHCQNCKAEFIIEPEDFEFYEKVSVPAPTFCPECRFQRRIMFRNERNLYKRNCAKCGKGMITMFPSEAPHLVYCSPCWWAFDWDPLDYGKEYDPSRPFFLQLKELLETTPVLPLNVLQSSLVNSEYINEASYAKNCYLIFNSDYCENSYYSNSLSQTKDVMDAFLLEGSELCYEVINSERCFNAFFSEDLTDCHNVYFSKNLTGCSDCFGCANLRNAKYHIWNSPYSKEEYTAKLAELKKQMRTAVGIGELAKQAEELWLTVPQKFMHGFQNVNVSGDYIYHSKNAHNVYQAKYLEDSKYCQLIKDKSAKDCYDYSVWGMNAERMYESVCCGLNTSDVKFSSACVNSCYSMEYSFYCGGGSSNFFGCVSLGKKEYCILNKQYTKEEYEALRARIIEDMNSSPYIDSNGRVWKYGEFLPYDLSPFYYNECLASEYFPRSQKEVLDAGWKWHDAKSNEYAITKKGSELIANGDEVEGSEILKEIIECIGCKKAYKFIQPEIDFLKRFQLPLPQYCSECRHRRRFSRLNPPKLWKRSCAKCNTAFETSYAPDRPGIIYCEQCYQAEVV